MALPITPLISQRFPTLRTPTQNPCLASQIPSARQFFQKRRFMPTLSRQTNALLLQVVEQIADGVLLTDQHGFIEYVNPAFETITGFSADDVRGKTPRILKSGLQDQAFYERLWAELMAGRSFQAIITNRRKTGEVYPVEETITPIVDENGRVSHFVAVIQDISETLHIQEREVQLRLAANSAEVLSSRTHRPRFRCCCGGLSGL
jgi:PAS domain S-box-containing protein